MERKAGEANRMNLYDDHSRLLQAEMSGTRNRRVHNGVCVETEHFERSQNMHVTNCTMERGGNNVGSINGNPEARVLYRTSGRRGKMGRGGTDDVDMMRRGEKNFI